MKKRLLVAVLVAAALVGFTLPGTALAGNIFHFRGTFADAFFSSTDSSGCIGTFVGLFANDGQFQSPPGPGSASSGAFVQVSQFDFCAETQLVDAFGFASLADPDFQVLGRLDSATLTTTIEVFDFVSGSSFGVDVAMTWAGTGDLSRSNSHFHFQSPGFIVSGHFNGTFRPAAASGSVTAGPTNFTPEPSVFAQIASTMSGTVIVE